MASFTVNDFADAVIGQDKNKIDPASLQGKVIGLYFSAHWCGPCRSFTPKLADRYNEIVSQGHPFEIIFISADENEEEALEYFASMPWKMIDFNERDKESDLSSKFGVRGIPTLVLVDADGKLITTEGREAVTTDFTKWTSWAAEKAEKERRLQEEMEALKSNFNPVTFFSTRKVIDKDGTAISADSLKGKVVGLYFSAHWCPPCRGFTPRLAEKYNTFIANGDAIEIIFVSSDRDSTGAKEYFAEMPWKMLDFDDRTSKQLLSAAFDVSGIPTLLLANEQGLITDEGREAIMSVDSAAKIITWKEEQAAAKARLAEEVLSMPESVTLPIHEHPLIKTPHVYRGAYGCDCCGGGGDGWVYHCDECGFDVHPGCVQKLLAGELTGEEEE